MLSEHLRPQVPPTRRDVVVTVLASVGEKHFPIAGDRLRFLVCGLAKASQVGAETFTEGGSRRALQETLLHLATNGLIGQQDLTLTDDGEAYVALIDPETRTFIGGFVAGAEHMEERYRDF